MGNQFVFQSSPDTDITVSNGKHSDFLWGSATIQGWRKSNEDRLQTQMDLNDDYSYFAVFDGHGGFEIAELLRRKFHDYIRECLIASQDDVELGMHLAFVNFDSYLRDPASKYVLNKMLEAVAVPNIAAEIARRAALPHGEIASGVTELPKDDGSTASTSKEGESLTEVKPDTSVIKEVGADRPSGSGSNKPIAGTSGSASQPIRPPSLQYLLNDDLASTDTEDSDFDIEEEESLSEDSDVEMDPEALLSQEPGDFSGSTATVVLVSKTKLHIANIGDSRCVLSRNGKAIDLSVDHNLDDLEERQRVLNAGGRVSADGRVNSSINISRAFGDFHLKGSTDIPAEQCVNAEPSVKSVSIEEGDDFVILASDGIWNSFTSQQLVDFVDLRIKKRDVDLIDICQEVFHLILPNELTDDGIGCDNMTMIIIKLNATWEHAYLYSESNAVTEVVDNDVDYEEKYYRDMVVS